VKGSIRAGKICKKNIGSRYYGLIIIVRFKKEYLLRINKDILRVSIIFGSEHRNVLYDTLNAVI